MFETVLNIPFFPPFKTGLVQRSDRNPLVPLTISERL